MVCSSICTAWYLGGASSFPIRARSMVLVTKVLMHGIKQHPQIINREEAMATPINSCPMRAPHLPNVLDNQSVTGFCTPDWAFISSANALNVCTPLVKVPAKDHQTWSIPLLSQLVACLMLFYSVMSWRKSERVVDALLPRHPWLNLPVAVRCSESGLSYSHFCWPLLEKSLTREENSRAQPLLHLPACIRQGCFWPVQLRLSRFHQCTSFTPWELEFG